MDLIKNAKEVAEALRSRATEARSKARSASHADVHVAHGESSFSAEAGASADAERHAEAGPSIQEQAPEE